MLAPFLALLAVNAARAEDPSDTAAEPVYPSSPPTSIDDAETVEKGHCEVNLTAGFSGNAKSWEAEAPLVDANLGLTDNIHVNAEIPYVLTGEGGAVSTGLGRGALAVKVRVLHLERVQLAFHPAVEFPPIPAVSVEAHGSASFTLPVVLDFAVGDRGAGVGVQLSHTFTGTWANDGWGAAVGFATPLDDSSALMFDYTQEATANLAFGEGWFEVGYVHENLFGSEHLTLLSSLGRSTQDNTAAMLGIQVSI